MVCGQVLHCNDIDQIITILIGKDDRSVEAAVRMLWTLGPAMYDTIPVSSVWMAFILNYDSFLL